MVIHEHEIPVAVAVQHEPDQRRIGGGNFSNLADRAADLVRTVFAEIVGRFRIVAVARQHDGGIMPVAFQVIPAPDIGGGDHHGNVPLVPGDCGPGDVSAVQTVGQPRSVAAGDGADFLRPDIGPASGADKAVDVFVVVHIRGIKRTPRTEGFVIPGQQVFVVLAVHRETGPGLLQVPRAGNAFGPGPGGVQRRQQHPRQDCDDGDHHEELDERKAPLPLQ